MSVTNRFRQSFLSKELEGYGIGSGHVAILMTISAKSGISQEELSNYLKIDKGCITKSVKKLEAEGYIDRRVDSADRRAYKLNLTSKGTEIIPSVRSVITEWENELRADFTDEEWETARRIVVKIAKRAFAIKKEIEATNQ